MGWRKIDIQKLSRHYPANVADVENVNNNAVEEVQKVCDRYGFVKYNTQKPDANWSEIGLTLNHNKLERINSYYWVDAPHYLFDHMNWLMDANGKIFLLSSPYNTREGILEDLGKYIHEDFIGYEILEENTYFPSKNTVSLLLFNGNI